MTVPESIKEHKIYIAQPETIVGMHVLAATLQMKLVYRPETANEALLANINPNAMHWNSSEGMDVVVSEDPAGIGYADFGILVTRNAVDTTHLGGYCVIQIPTLYQHMWAEDSAEEPLMGIDAEDVALAVGGIISAPHLHRNQRYCLGHAVSASYLQAIRNRLPRSRDEPRIVKSLVTHNDSNRILPGHELGTLEEFWHKSQQSLYHQRFLLQ